MYLIISFLFYIEQKNIFQKRGRCNVVNLIIDTVKEQSTKNSDVDKQTVFSKFGEQQQLISPITTLFQKLIIIIIIIEYMNLQNYFTEKALMIRATVFQYVIPLTSSMLTAQLGYMFPSATCMEAGWVMQLMPCHV